MKRTNLDSWIEELEGIGSLNREKLEALQLERLGELLKKKKRGTVFTESCPIPFHPWMSSLLCPSPQPTT